MPKRTGRPSGAAKEARKAAAERQAKCYRLHAIQRLTAEETAQVLGISVATVNRDCQAVRKRLRSGIEELKARGPVAAMELAGETVAEYDAAIRQAWADLQRSPAGSAARARFLRTLLQSISQRAKLLQDLGLLEKVPEKLEVAGIDASTLSDAELAAALDFLAAAAGKSDGRLAEDSEEP